MTPYYPLPRCRGWIYVYCLGPAGYLAASVFRTKSEAGFFRMSHAGPGRRFFSRILT